MAKKNFFQQRSFKVEVQSRAILRESSDSRAESAVVVSATQENTTTKFVVGERRRGAFVKSPFQYSSVVQRTVRRA